jgi:selenocysteine-specific elongation factor
LIIATAGHVDHGKTSLVRNLTGVETDRLEEEQRRGLSISLGYAYWRPDDSTSVGFIDVPGHRRFINNMISGISGIDLGMLVVAADDGPMPQTREHLQVMSLLGVEDYLLVVSKCDRVDEQRVQRVCNETAALLPTKTPVYKVSNTTNIGIDDLRGELERRAREWTARTAKGHFRMSVDRAFNLQGRGLVLTGTIASGVIETGKTVILQPQQIALRVRNIHTQDKPSTIGRAGERCALNVSGDVHKDDIERGDWVVGENGIDTTTRFDTRLRLLPDAPFPLKHLSEVKLHIGAKYCKARLLLLRNRGSGPSRINPGESALAQIVTERPVLCYHGDRFLLRDNGETATLGGGIVLDPHGVRIRKSSTTRLGFLTAMEQDDVEGAIRAALNDANCTLDYNALLKSWNLDRGDRPGDGLPGIARISTDNGELWLAESAWASTKDQIMNSLLNFHDRNTDEPGMRLTQLARVSLPHDEQRLFQPAIVEMIKSGNVKLADGLLSADGFSVQTSEQDDSGWLAVSACLQKHGRQVPNIIQLQEECGLDDEPFERAVSRALRDRRIVKISPERYVETAVVNEYALGVLKLTAKDPNLTVAGLRDHMGCGRNVLVEFLEYFDSIGFTRRTVNARVVLDRKLPAKRFNKQQ